MDEEEIRGWIEQLLDELAAIRIELDALESPAADPTWLVVIAALAVALAAAALVVAMLALRSRDRAASPSEVDGQRDARAAFASELRTYSQVLGVEAVTGRPAGGGDSAEAVRARLDARAADLDAPGALELLDEVRKSRRRLADLPPETRAASSGLAGMTVEWSIDRWAHDPEAWLRDHRERARLQALGRRAAGHPASTEPEEADTRRR